MILSARDLEHLKKFLEAPARDYDPDGPKGQDPYNKALAWARDPEYGGLPERSARGFADWLSGCWAEWSEDESHTVKDVLEGAITDWCGGRVMPS